MAKNTAKTVVAGDTVRSFILANPSEGITVGAERGRLSNKAVAYFHEKNPSLNYVAGTKVQTMIPLVLPKEVTGKSRNEKREVTVSEARALAGEAAGLRGILSPAAIEAAGLALAEQVKATAKAPKPAAVVAEKV